MSDNKFQIVSKKCALCGKGFSTTSNHAKALYCSPKCQKKVYYAKNKERIAKRNADYYYRNHDKEKERRRRYAEANKETFKKNNALWRKNNPGVWNEYAKKYRERFIEKHGIEAWKARNRKTRKKYYEKKLAEVMKGRRGNDEIYRKKVIARERTRALIRSGKLVRQSCEVCGNVKTEAHHDNYDKPDKVRWLCMKCHREYHKREADKTAT